MKNVWVETNTQNYQKLKSVSPAEFVFGKITTTKQNGDNMSSFRLLAIGDVVGPCAVEYIRKTINELNPNPIKVPIAVTTKRMPSGILLLQPAARIANPNGANSELNATCEIKKDRIYIIKSFILNKFLKSIFLLVLISSSF